jgi:hypothetical protein
MPPRFLYAARRDGQNNDQRCAVKAGMLAPGSDDVLPIHVAAARQQLRFEGIYPRDNTPVSTRVNTADRVFLVTLGETCQQ